MLLCNLSPAHLDPVLPMVVQMHSANVVEDRVISVVNDIVGDHSRELNTLQERGGEGRGGEGRGGEEGETVKHSSPRHPPTGALHTHHTHLGGKDASLEHDNVIVVQELTLVWYVAPSNHRAEHQTYNTIYTSFLSNHTINPSNHISYCTIRLHK